MKALFFALVFAAPALASAHGPNTAAYHQVGGVSFTEVVPTAAEIASGYLEAPAFDSLSPLDLANVDWSQLILVGEKVIELVKRGAPVVNIKRSSVSVLPLGSQAWQQLAGWQVPVTRVYTLAVKNALGVTVVDLRLKVSSMWGGNFDGRGKYLANVQVLPVAVKVLWGWSLDLWTESQDPVNAGTKVDPIAGLGLELRYKIGTALNELNGTQDYYLTGDGKILELP